MVFSCVLLIGVSTCKPMTRECVSALPEARWSSTKVHGVSLDFESLILLTISLARPLAVRVLELMDDLYWRYIPRRSWRT